MEWFTSSSKSPGCSASPQAEEHSALLLWSVFLSVFSKGKSIRKESGVRVREASVWVDVYPLCLVWQKRNWGTKHCPVAITALAVLSHPLPWLNCTGYDSESGRTPCEIKP